MVPATDPRRNLCVAVSWTARTIATPLADLWMAPRVAEIDRGQRVFVRMSWAAFEAFRSNDNPGDFGAARAAGWRVDALREYLEVRGFAWLSVNPKLLDHEVHLIGYGGPHAAETLVRMRVL